MNKIEVKLLKWGASGFRAVDSLDCESDEETGVDLEVVLPDKSRTTLRVTVDADGSVHVSEPVPWSR